MISIPNKDKKISDCPCKGCEVRTEDCHGRCALYIGWTGKLKQKKEEERKVKRAMWDVYNRRSDAIHACMKKKGRYKR